MCCGRTGGALTRCQNKNCRKKFCEHCLKKFYKEGPVPPGDKTWRCPSCRKICCCAACRRRKMREAGQLPPSTKKPTKVPGPKKPKDSMRKDKTVLHHMVNGGMPPGDDISDDSDDSSSDSSDGGGDTTSESFTREFQLLFALSNTPALKKFIRYLLLRADLNEEQKADSVANLLRSHVAQA
jgi:hypothetical protein